MFEPYVGSLYEHDTSTSNTFLITMNMRSIHYDIAYDRFYETVFGTIVLHCPRLEKKLPKLKKNCCSPICRKRGTI